MRYFLSVSLLVVFLFQKPVFIHAQTADFQPVKLLAGAAVEFGGTRLLEVTFTDGSEQTIYSGQGVSGFGGLEYRFKAQPKASLRATAGFKYVTTAADDYHIRFTRIPIALTANWMADKDIRLAAGYVTHKNILLNMDGFSDNITFTTNGGFVLEAAYGYFGLSFTNLTYKGESGEKYLAKALGFTFSYPFSLK